MVSLPRACTGVRLLGLVAAVACAALLLFLAARTTDPFASRWETRTAPSGQSLDGPGKPVAESAVPTPPPAPSPSPVADTSLLLACPEAAGIKTGVMRPLDPQALRRNNVPRAVWGLTLGEAKHGGGGASRYDLSTPLAAAAWRRLGYEPLVIVVAENEKHAERLRADDANGVHSLLELKAMGVELHVTPPAQGKSPGQTGQLVRMAATATESLWNSEAVITTDADMIPLSLPYFQAGKMDTMTVFNHGILSNQFAMCYLQSPARLWREILHIAGDKPQLSLTSAVHAGFSSTGAGTWATDQQEVTDRIMAWPKWETQGHTVAVSNTPGWRLDRSSSIDNFLSHVRQWEQCEVPGVDFHMQYLRPGDCAGTATKAIDAVIVRLFDSKDLALLRNYIKRVTCDV